MTPPQADTIIRVDDSGLVQISTTITPGFNGNFLVTMTNCGLNDGGTFTVSETFTVNHY